MACYQTVRYPVPRGLLCTELMFTMRTIAASMWPMPSIHHLPCPFLIWGRNNGQGGLFRITAIHLGPKQHWQLFTTLALQLGRADRVSLRILKGNFHRWSRILELTGLEALNLSRNFMKIRMEPWGNSKMQHYEIKNCLNSRFSGGNKWILDRHIDELTRVCLS